MPRSVLIVPAYNEASRLAAVLDAATRAATGCELVVIDDGSQDDTAGVARRAGATVLRHSFNLGYGAALQTGYKYALDTGAESLAQMDADGQHDPAQLVPLLSAVVEGGYDLVVGSRFLEPTGFQMGWARNLGRRLFSGVARLAGLRVSDPTSGFQAMNRRVLEVYALDFFPTDYPDVDVLLAAYRHGLRVGERPVRMSEGTRASRLHGGLRSVYYVYKMMLSTWTTPARLAGGRSSTEARPR